MSEKFHGLDEMRGYAAAIVVLFHFSTLLGTSWFFPSGYLAVDLFFVMSGFVIAHSYDRTIRLIGVAAFMKKRLIRFYPLLFVGISLGLLDVVGLLLTHHNVYGVLSALPAGLLFIPSPPSVYSDGAVAPLDGPEWSLILEVWINLAYALLLPKLRPGVLIAIIGTAIPVLCVTAFYANILGGGALLLSMWVGIARIILSFPAGVFLYRYRSMIKLPSQPPWRLGLVLAIILMMPGSAVHDLTFVLIISPIIVIIAAQHTNENVASRYGATSSYCLYIIHLPALGLVSGLTNRLSIRPLIPIIVAIVVLFVLSPLLDRYYDRPIRRWLTRGREKTSQPAMPVVGAPDAGTP